MKTPKLRYATVMQYDVGKYHKGDIISRHSTYAAANKRASLGPFSSFVRVVDLLETGTIKNPISHSRTNVVSLMRAASLARSKTHIRLLRGKFTKLINNAAISESLRESAKREFDRVAAHALSVNRNPIKREKFFATRSKSKALRLAKAAGFLHPIATKVQGGFVVYEAY